MNRKIWIVLYICFAFLSLLLILILQKGFNKQSIFFDPNAPTMEYQEGQIVKINQNAFTVALKDQTPPLITFESDPDYLFNDYQEKDLITLYKITDQNGSTYDIVDYLHLDGIIFVFLIFVGITIWVARSKGFFSIISLVLSSSLFYFIFLKAIQNGYSPLLACLLFVISFTILTIPLIHGFNRKSGSSLIAINLGFILSLSFSYLFKIITRIGDKSSESLRTLALQIPEINLGEILIVILFLGAIGALIDTSITISSAIFESHKKQEEFNFKNNFNLGMEVGKDILGSMINTLLLAYLASSIPFFILITHEKGTQLREILNYDFIALEITRTLIGATSLVVLIPLTTVIASWMLLKNQSKLKAD